MSSNFVEVQGNNINLRWVYRVDQEIQTGIATMFTIGGMVDLNLDESKKVIEAVQSWIVGYKNTETKSFVNPDFALVLAKRGQITGVTLAIDKQEIQSARTVFYLLSKQENDNE